MFNFAGTDAHAHVWVGPGLAKLLSTSWITHAKELCAFIVLKMPKKYGQYVTLHCSNDQNILRPTRSKRYGCSNGDEQILLL